MKLSQLFDSYNKYNQGLVMKGGIVFVHAGRVIKFDDKDELLKLMLKCIKDGGQDAIPDVKSWIKGAKEQGYDYPEFAAIEKSINSLDLKESFDRDFIAYDPEVKHNVRIRYDDKDRFLKFLLRVLKDHSYSSNTHLEIRSRIHHAREIGCDYPEFKAIEKSIGK